MVREEMSEVVLLLLVNLDGDDNHMNETEFNGRNGNVFVFLVLA